MGIYQLREDIQAATIVYLGACYWPESLCSHQLLRIPIIAVGFCFCVWKQFDYGCVTDTNPPLEPLGLAQALANSQQTMLPLYMTWTEAINWGIKLEDTTGKNLWFRICAFYLLAINARVGSLPSA